MIGDTEEQNDKVPSTFLSYSWEEKEHNEWVLGLADKLRTDGIQSELDQYYLKDGLDIFQFEERLIHSNKIITILTPTYKHKADSRINGIGDEIRMIISEFSKYQHLQVNKIIPIIRKGNKDSSLPNFFGRGILFIDFTIDDNFNESYDRLVRTIYDKPFIRVPPIGKKPTFSFRPIETSHSNIDSGKIDQPFNKVVRSDFSISTLEALLKANDLLGADRETMNLLLNVFENKNKFITKSQIAEVPCEVIVMIDNVWTKYSDGKYGFNVQKLIWNRLLLGNQTRSFLQIKFGDCVGWRKNDMWIKDFAENAETEGYPTGHFPRLRQFDYNNSEWLSAWLNNVNVLLSKFQTCLV